MIRFLCKSCNVRDKSSSFDFGLKTAIESAPTCLESAISLPFRNRCRLYRYYIRNVTLRGVMLLCYIEVTSGSSFCVEPLQCNYTTKYLSVLTQLDQPVRRKLTELKASEMNTIGIGLSYTYCVGTVSHRIINTPLLRRNFLYL